MFPIPVSSVPTAIGSALAQVAPAAEPVEPLWRIILRDFPRDAGAIALYVILAISIGLVWWAHLKSRAGGGPPASGERSPPRTGTPDPDGEGPPSGVRPKGPRRAA